MQGRGLTQTLHVLRRLGIRILVTSNGGENFRKGNQHVRHCLHPHVDGSGLVAGAGVVATWAQLVNVVLRDGSGNHGCGGQQVSNVDTLDRGEVEAHLAETRVEELIHDRDEDNEGKGVQVVDNIVRHAVQLHGGRLRCQVVGHLSVGQPCGDQLERPYGFRSRWGH